jgi:peroxiredoxin Q/BCP
MQTPLPSPAPSARRRWSARAATVVVALCSLGVNLTPGALAPPFSRSASNGQTISLAQYKDKQTVVLAFFPKAFTGG